MRLLHRQSTNAIENFYQLTDNVYRIYLGVGYVRKYLFILMAALLLVACGNDEESTQDNKQVEEKDTTENNDNVQDEEDSHSGEGEDEPEEDDSWDDLKDKDKIVGKSDKDFSGISNSDPADVRNDSTGNWRKMTFAENANIEEYALSYKDMHMKDGETHFVINFNYDTTAVLNDLNGLLYVDIHEYEKKEEHDADTIGSGMDLKSYVIYPDGDIQEIEE